jgi:DNA-binding GntR family transcriptional regulator
MFEQLLPTTIASHIYEQLRRGIIEGEYRPGQPLREEELHELHGSSRGPIRESLRMLLQTGLVEHRPRRGFRVRAYTARDIRQIYRLRATLESQLVAALHGRDLAPLIAPLEAGCAAMDAHYARSDLVSYLSENREFHQSIIDFADDRILREVLEYVNEVSLPVRYRLLGDALPSRRSLTYHERIVAHIKAGDIDAAQRLTEAHILENLEHAVAAFDRDTEESATLT